MLTQYANNSVTFLAEDLTDTDTTVTVQSAANFPQTGPYYIAIENEILQVSAVVGNNLTVLRSQQSTVAVPHSFGNRVGQVVTPNDLAGSVKLFQTYASNPAAGTAGRLWWSSSPPPISAYDDGTNWNYKFFGNNTGQQLFVDGTAPNNTFSWLNQGTSIQENTELGYSGILGQLGSGDNIRARMESTPTPPYSRTMYMNWISMSTVGHLLGFVLRQSSNGKIILFGLTSVPSLAVSKYDTVVNQNGSYAMGATFAYGYQSHAGLWLKVVDDGTNRYYQISQDTVYWYTVLTTLRTDFITPDQIGYGGTLWPNVPFRIHAYSWQRGTN